MALVLFVFYGNAQSKEEIDEFSVVKKEKVTINNEMIKEFLEKSNFTEQHSAIKIDESCIEIQTFKNGRKGILIPTVNNEFQKIYVFYFENESAYTYFFLKSEKEKTYTFSKDLVLLYTGSNINGDTSIVYNAENRSAFGKCMDAVEDDFTDTLVGWVYWNGNPQVQALAAGMCYTCTRWGWGCPAAYSPPTPKK